MCGLLLVAIRLSVRKQAVGDWDIPVGLPAVLSFFRVCVIYVLDLCVFLFAFFPGAILWSIGGQAVVEDDVGAEVEEGTFRSWRRWNEELSTLSTLEVGWDLGSCFFFSPLRDVCALFSLCV